MDRATIQSAKYCKLAQKFSDIKVNVNGKIHLRRAAFANTAFSGAVVTDRAAVQRRQQQAKSAHLDFELCPHSAARGH